MVSTTSTANTAHRSRAAAAPRSSDPITTTRRGPVGGRATSRCTRGPRRAIMRHHTAPAAGLTRATRRPTLPAMPLFRRPDGVLCRDVPPMRRILPYLMRGRNESAVYHEKAYGLTRARPWLRAYNRSHRDRATLLHPFLYACARALHARPGLNRFVSGGRIYQHKGVAISFAAKKMMRDAAPFVTVKVEIPPHGTFEDAVRHIRSEE